MTSFSFRPLRSFFAATVLALAAAAPAAAQDIVIGEGQSASWGQFYVADSQKLWEKQGLNPKAVTFPSGRLVLDALVGGGVAIGTAAETPVVFAALNGLPVRIIGTLNRHEPFDVVTSKDITSIAGLKGKKVGYSQGTNAHYYLLKALESAGLKLSDVTAVSLTPSDFVTSLDNGALDAFVWTEPHISKALSVGGGRFHALKTPGLYFGYSAIITLQSTIDEKPELVTKALKALIEADKVVKTDPEAAIAIVSEKIKLSPETTKGFWDRFNFQVALDKPQLVADLKTQAQWAIDNKLVRPDAAIPDFDKVVVDAPLRAAQGE
ncbi:nitrate ABC transporter substrate-binding protein [Methylopila jiangsuensis]|uniref:Nitrate ABC transporter substrate-binding protein n=1 Tax=Methylopila jiangsuensis TaxID=586230 RepID=A0A9W6N4Y2_9HYPH|nr:NrtA/SsuA/CpmA family ABC transporter substrate-binding protein [Methylopila jiangsuensis]MDR6284901.1 NitT/TauT family transport system substrate-binding protein [Methylopila jiangsuensis]GLK77711.1 nitrate ABC transporter substrate-binding protein [Methylopila jiangsuensis]